jgi:hypothetical protein
MMLGSLSFWKSTSGTKTSGSVPSTTRWFRSLSSSIWIDRAPPLYFASSLSRPSRSSTQFPILAVGLLRSHRRVI